MLICGMGNQSALCSSPWVLPGLFAGQAGKLLSVQLECFVWSCIQIYFSHVFKNTVSIIYVKVGTGSTFLSCKKIPCTSLVVVPEMECLVQKRKCFGEAVCSWHSAFSYSSCQLVIHPVFHCQNGSRETSQVLYVVHSLELSELLCPKTEKKILYFSLLIVFHPPLFLANYRWWPHYNM